MGLAVFICCREFYFLVILLLLDAFFYLNCLEDFRYIV